MEAKNYDEIRTLMDERQRCSNVLNELNNNFDKKRGIRMEFLGFDGFSCYTKNIDERQDENFFNTCLSYFKTKYENKIKEIDSKLKEL